MPTIPELLDFAATHPTLRGHAEEQVRRDLGIGPARYLQLLMRAAGSMGGQAYDPITAHRILREKTGRMHHGMHHDRS